MTFAVKMSFPESTPKEDIEEALLAAIDEMGEMNAKWYWRQWNAGHLQMDEKCCAGCAELRHVPDKRDVAIDVVHVSEAIRRGVASCQTAVAMSLGHERAVAWTQGASRQEAREMFSPLAVPEADGAPGYWHIVMQTPHGVEDPSAEMKPGIGAGGGVKRGRLIGAGQAATEGDYDSSGRPRGRKAPGDKPSSCECSGKEPPGGRPVR